MDRILLRSAILRLLFVASLVLVGLVGSAHAGSAQRGAAVPDVRLASALFTPTRADDGFTWHARYVMTPESAAEIDEGSALALRFAVPLSEGDAVETSFGIDPLVEDGRVTGILVDRAGVDGRLVNAVVHQHSVHEGTLRLGAPVGAGSALQIVDGDLGAGTRFELETGRLFERGVGHVQPPGTSHAAREEARRLTGYQARVTGAPLYVRGDDVVAAHGLTATMVTPRARGRRGMIALGLVFAAIVVVLLTALRKLRHSASVERADALLAAEVDALGNDPRRV